MERQERLGIDIGRVIIEGDRPGGDTSFISGDLSDVLRTPAVPGALDAVRRLVQRFDGAVWLVSKCGRRVQEKTWIWLRDRHFFELTGLPETHVRFCRQRPEKADHARQLGLTSFVDDRPDVLQHLRGIVPNLFLFGAYCTPDEWFTPVLDWEEAERAIDAALSGR